MIDSVRLSSAELRQRQIVDLEHVLAALSEADRERFARLYEVSSAVGRLVPPDHMRRWIVKYFGSVEAVSEQKVVRVTNRWTLEGSLFNELRARRPLEARIPADLANEIARTAPDPFCEPELNTPEDVFGRIEGKHAVTASNIAKYDGYHGVVIFREHDPLAFTEASVKDAIDVAVRWQAKSSSLDSEAIYPLIMWNCLWKSGASIPHGHLQVSLTKGMHYGHIESQRRAGVAYTERTGGNYYDDLYQAHESLGLGRVYNGVRVMAHVTPLKEKECLIVGSALDEAFTGTVYSVLNCLTDYLNVVSFNLVIWRPPLRETGENWADFPVIARIVDRGDPLNRTSDFGAMELYAASVVSSDPFKVAGALWERLGG
ncbi:MAG TPA: hypothetical protein PK593_03170 [Thermomicrobiales bacterium]|nr:hypothetical protein [Thermomicrobiales bacterium]HQZ91020.1 hypothetical protein [Thermomicrobiales bacterium]HRA32683.1 hypothetical protein [Thermomicrobiales bacterium]